MKHYDVFIIGGGVVGSAIARELSKYRLSVALAEKEADVSEGTSKANSGVLHAGFNVRPGSLKARLNVEGLRAFPGLAEELGVSWNRCGKLVVAFRKAEFAYLDRLLEQGRANGCPDLSIIGRDEIISLEPKVRGERALYSPHTGIVTPFRFNIALAENAADNGVAVLLSTEVTAVRRSGNIFRISVKRMRRQEKDLSVENDLLSAGIVINCAGLFAGDIARTAGSPVPETFPCRGEYFIVDRKAVRRSGKKPLLSLAVYPVPPADGSGLGVHLTPTLNGNILIGPSAEYVDLPDDLENTRRIMDVLKNEARRLLPELEEFDLIKSYAGMRAKLFAPGDGISFADFHIAESRNVPGLINLAGIESPGLTASPAIASMVAGMVGEKIPLTEKENFRPRWRGVTRLDTLSAGVRMKVVRDNPDFGEIVCRCEGVTRGEILQALDNSLGVKTLNGIKKRTHAMMGRCQSGFCLPRIYSILSDRGVTREEIVKDGPEGRIALGERQ